MDQGFSWSTQDNQVHWQTSPRVVPIKSSLLDGWPWLGLILNRAVPNTKPSWFSWSSILPSENMFLQAVSISWMLMKKTWGTQKQLFCFHANFSEVAGAKKGGKVTPKNHKIIYGVYIYIHTFLERFWRGWCQDRIPQTAGGKHAIHNKNKYLFVCEITTCDDVLYVHVSFNPFCCCNLTFGSRTGVKGILSALLVLEVTRSTCHTWAGCEGFI
jgi:hypothetical protein